MRTAAVLAVIGFLAFGAVAAGGKEKFFFGGTPPSVPAVADGPPESDIAAMIAALGDPDYRVREKAGRDLEAKGEKVLPDLRRALNATDSPEVSRRLAVLVRRMDHARLVAPKRITSVIKNKTAKDAFDEIAKQSGYKIDYQVGGGGTDGRYSFEFDDTPFWRAIDKVAETAGVGVYANYDDDAIQINSYSGSYNPYVAYAGPFRLVAGNISASKNVQLSGLNRPGGGNRSQESINLNFQIHSEPKNPILGALPAELSEAIDDTGMSLLPPKDLNHQRTSYYHNQGYRGFQASGSVSLVRGARDATAIKVLKGKIGIVLLANTLPDVLLADPLKAKDKKLVGRTVEVDFDSLSEANGQYTASLTVRKTTPQEGGQIDYNWVNNLWQKMDLLDDKGNRYRGYQNNTNVVGSAVQMTVAFSPDNRRGVPQKIGPPVKFVVNEWLQVIHEVAFEFKNVPLP